MGTVKRIPSLCQVSVKFTTEGRKSFNHPTQSQLEILLLMSKDNPVPTGHITTKVCAQREEYPVLQQNLLELILEVPCGAFRWYTYFKSGIHLPSDGIKQVNPDKEASISTLFIRNLMAFQESDCEGIVLRQAVAICLYKWLHPGVVREDP